MTICIFPPRGLSFGLSKKIPKAEKRLPIHTYFITFEACVEKFKMLSFVLRQTKVDLIK